MPGSIPRGVPGRRPGPRRHRRPPGTGELPGPEARRLLDELRRAGLRAELRNTSGVSYLPLDRTTGAALLVQDAAESRRVAEEMIQAGVPVEWLAE